MRLHRHFLTTRTQSLNTKHISRKQIHRRSPPCMVPILIRLEFLIPRLPSYRRSALHHMSPIPLSRCNHQLNRRARLTTFKQSFQQILSRINRTLHPTILQPTDNRSAIRGRNQIKRKRKQICMQGVMVNFSTVPIQSSVRIKKSLLKSRLSLGFQIGVVDRICVPTNRLPHHRHKAQ